MKSLNWLKFGLVASALAMTSLASSFSNAASLRILNGGDPASLDPHKVSGDWENRIVGDIFEGLMTENAKAEPILGMAESYDVSDDGLVYTFTLKDGIKWSDGTAVTAADFEFALKRLFNPETAAKYAYLQFTIAGAESYNKGEASADEVGVKALDDKTVEFTLKEPAPFFLGALTHYTAYPVPQHVVEEFGDQWVKMEYIVTNGPYKPTEWIPGSHVKTVINDQWYDTESLNIDDVTFVSLEDTSSMTRSFLAGEAQWTTRYVKDQYDKLKKEMPEVLQVAPFAGLYYYVVNNNRPPFDNADIRKALSMAINREAITESITGTGEVPAYSWVPPGMANYQESYELDWKDLDYSEKVAQASAILEENGFNKDNPLEITLRYNTDDNHKRIAIAIVSMWKAVGIEAKLHNTEVKVHYADLKNNEFDVARAGWLADYNDPINFLTLLDDNNDNYGRWVNDEYKSLLDQAAQETDLIKRAGTLKQAEQIALDNSAAIPLYYYVTENLVSPKLKGFEHNVFDTHRTRYLSLEE